MNSVDTASPVARWLPSHVQITIHQARELHLKSKSGHSELYVSLQVDKERFLTSSLPRQLGPHWNETFVIPLMSLANTIHITVRQKGRFGDSYLGYIPLNPGSFKIAPNQVTHWYKLGAKPGKSSTKLRGDLQVTFQFLSKWASRADTEGTFEHGGMLRRSSSDLRLHSKRHADLNEGMVGRSNQLKKRELLSSLRRSFRRKPKSPAFQNCEDEFASFSSQSTSSTPQNIRRKTNSYVSPDNISNMSSTGQLSNGMSDSDTGNSTSHSPPSLRAGKESSASECGDTPVGSLDSKEVEDIVPDGKMTPSKFYNFKSKKRPWSMAALPVPTPTPTSTPMVSSERPLVQDHAHEEDEEEEGAAEEVKQSLSQPHEEEVTTFKYKSRPSVRSRSFRSHDPAASRLALQRTNSPNPSSSVSTGPSTTHRPHEEQEAAGRSDQYRQSSLSEESSASNSVEGSKMELSSVAGEEGSGRREEQAKSPSFRSHPYSRRIEISPRTNSPTTQRSRPRILSYGKAESPSDGSGGGARKTGPGALARRSTLSSMPTGRRLLPAPPVRRGTARQTATPSSKKSTPVLNSVKHGGGGMDAISSFATKLVDSLETVARKENLPLDDVDEEADGGAREEVPRLQTTPSDSTSSINSREEQGGSSRVKHTVLYNSSAMGFQPATLLPPSLRDYTHHSQTLPVRGKHSRRKHASSTTQALHEGSSEGDHAPKSSCSTPAGSVAGEASESPSPTKLPPKPDQSPPNTRYTPQALLAHMPPRTPPSPSAPSSSSSTNTTRNFSSSETDGGMSEDRRQSPVVGQNVTSSSASALKKYSSGKNPGDIVTDHLRNRRPAGGLKKAISMYQENRRQSTSTRRNAEDVRGEASAEDEFGRDSDRLHLVESTGDRTSFSARSSPLLRRSTSRTGSITNLFLTSLRRTRSHFFTTSHRHHSEPRPLSMGADPSGEDQPDSTSREDMEAALLRRTGRGAKNTSAPGILARALGVGGKQQVDTHTVDERREEEEKQESTKTPEVLIRVRTATLTSADSSSVHTLTDASAAADLLSNKEQRFSPNPAGAASAASGSHVRHTTSSSVESEGFHSINSEDTSLDDLMHQDWSQWSKEDLVKELISCRSKLINTEEKLNKTDSQLKETRAYMDNLLLRIMETNPSILSANPH